jgi:hypothetical protein
MENKIFENTGGNNFKVVNEATLSRVWQHITNSKSFAVISPFRSENDLEKNMELYQQLKDSVRALGHGYIEQKSGYTYDDGTIADERSLFIPNISFDDAIKLGKKYNQETILYKDAQQFVLYNPTSKQIVMNFSKNKNDAVTFNPDILKYAYSEFLNSKNKNSKKRFAFVATEEYHIPSRTDSYTAMKENKGLVRGQWKVLFSY